MQFNPVESTNIAGAGYDAKTKTMGVLFKNKTLYFYVGVEHEEYDAFEKSESKGSYFNKNIKTKQGFFKVDGTVTVELNEVKPMNEEKLSNG